MRILYLSLSYVPSRRASSVQVMKMCEALAELEHRVTLVTKSCASRQEATELDDFAFYGVEPRFEIEKVSRPETKGGGLIYLAGLIRKLILTRPRPDLVFCRDLLGAAAAIRLGHRVLFEAHGIPKGRRDARLLRSVVGSSRFVRLVVISKALEDLLGQMDCLPENADIVVAHDAAVPLEVGAVKVEEDKALRVGYVGHLYPGRGVEQIVEIARRLPDLEFHLVGGAEADLLRWQSANLPGNVSFLGFVPPAELSALYEGFDILLMPYQERVQVASGSTDTSRWMSPMKMFEYMSAGRAIVSSDLPVLREVLQPEVNSLLVSASAVDEWVEAIRRLGRDSALRERLGLAARESLLAHHTWDKRARSVLQGLEHPN